VLSMRYQGCGCYLHTYIKPAHNRFNKYNATSKIATSKLTSTRIHTGYCSALEDGLMSLPLSEGKIGPTESDGPPVRPCI